MLLSVAKLPFPLADSNWDPHLSSFMTTRALFSQICYCSWSLLMLWGRDGTVGKDRVTRIQYSSFNTEHKITLNNFRHHWRGPLATAENFLLPVSCHILRLLSSTTPLAFHFPFPRPFTHSFLKGFPQKYKDVLTFLSYLSLPDTPLRQLQGVPSWLG